MNIKSLKILTAFIYKVAEIRSSTLTLRYHTAKYEREKLSHLILMKSSRNEMKY